ncbi:MAG: hypothetical protein ABL949_02120 [Fimbriimonadaceae bacterium]
MTAKQLILLAALCATVSILVFFGITAAREAHEVRDRLMTIELVKKIADNVLLTFPGGNPTEIKWAEFCEAHSDKLSVRFRGLDLKLAANESNFGVPVNEVQSPMFALVPMSHGNSFKSFAELGFSEGVSLGIRRDGRPYQIYKNLDASMGNSASQP